MAAGRACCARRLCPAEEPGLYHEIQPEYLVLHSAVSSREALFLPQPLSPAEFSEPSSGLSISMNAIVVWDASWQDSLDAKLWNTER